MLAKSCQLTNILITGCHLKRSASRQRNQAIFFFGKEKLEITNVLARGSKTCLFEKPSLQEDPSVNKPAHICQIALDEAQDQTGSLDAETKAFLENFNAYVNPDCVDEGLASDNGTLADILDSVENSAQHEKEPPAEAMESAACEAMGESINAWWHSTESLQRKKKPLHSMKVRRTERPRNLKKCTLTNFAVSFQRFQPLQNQSFLGQQAATPSAGFGEHSIAAEAPSLGKFAGENKG
jgi:hypothetical protein